MLTKFYKLVGAGGFEEITAQEYEQALRVAISSEYHEELRQPGHGFQYKGIAYLAF